MAAIDWSLLGPAPNVGGAFQAGLQSGQAQRDQRELRGALAQVAENPNDAGAIARVAIYDPQRASALGGLAKENRVQGALGRLFSNPAAQGALAAPMQPGSPDQRRGDGPTYSRTGEGSPIGALAPFAQPALGSVEGSAIAGPPGGGEPVLQSPPSLVDPVNLPPRTDGVQLNRDALRELYTLDLDSALKVQRMIYDGDRQSFDRMKNNGEVVGRLAYHLSQFPAGEARQAEFEAAKPQLVNMGLDPQNLSGVDLTDKGLQRYLNIGRTITALVDDDRADRALDASISDDEADNMRADRSTDSLVASRNAGAAQGWARVGITREGMERTDARGRRGQDMSSADRRRGQDVTDRRIREAGSRGARGGGKTAEPPRISSKAAYAALPKGAAYIAPDGSERVKD